MSQKTAAGYSSQGDGAGSASFKEFDEELPPAYDAIDSPGPSRPPQPAPRPQGAAAVSHQPWQGASLPNKPWSAQGQYQAPQQQQQNLFQRPQAPFNYPPGYFCNQCHNTGVKLHNGHPCGFCERSFGRQGGHVQYAPPGMLPIGGVTYMAGDPRIGGRLCGNCKGHGIRRSMMGLMEEQCKTSLTLRIFPISHS